MATRPLSALEVRLTGELPEVPPGFSWGGEHFCLYEVERAIRRAASDKRVHALILVLEEPELGWSKAESLFRAIWDFRELGKPTVCFFAGGGNAAYMLASACEHIILQRSTPMFLQPLASEAFFFKDLLGAIGVDAQLDAVGEFKSMGEMFQRHDHSAPHREELRALLSDLQDQFVSRIAAGRALRSETVPKLLERGPFLPEDARAEKLVDSLGHEDDCDTVFEERLGNRLERIPMERYRPGGSWWRRWTRWRRPRIAVIHATGMIVSGEGRRAPGSRLSSVGSRSLSQLFRQARESKRVRGVVLRIDSPGGGASASDAIRREVELTLQEKPVVVSMGDVAASGGYYIATAAAAVIAEGTTLTGSIGVAGGKFVIKRLLDRLGIQRETVALGVKTSMFSPLRPFADSEREWHRNHLQHFYEKRFLPVVAEGRRLSMAEADDVGRGRVWTGRQGKEVGLVDELGGLDHAIGVACVKASIPTEKAKVVFLARRSRLRALLARRMTHAVTPGEALWGSLGLLEDFLGDDVLLLMPRFFRIR